MHATLTSKGQITLPIDLRKKLGLCTGDKVEFIIEDEQSVRMVPKNTPVAQLRGMLPRPSEPVSLKKMKEAVKKGSGLS